MQRLVQNIFYLSKTNATRGMIASEIYFAFITGMSAPSVQASLILAAFTVSPLPRAQPQLL